jgi:hypothetical protein
MPNLISSLYPKKYGSFIDVPTKGYGLVFVNGTNVYYQCSSDLCWQALPVGTNHAPVLSNPVPADWSEQVSLYPTMRITANDADGDDMNVSFQSNATGSWESFGDVKFGADNKFGYGYNDYPGLNGDSCNDVIRGTWFTCPANGTAYSINVNGEFSGQMPYGKKAKAALYYKSNNTWFASTRENTYKYLIGCPDGVSYCPWWNEFTFASPHRLVAGREYYVVIWGDDMGMASYSNLSCVNRSISVNHNYGAWPNTLSSISYLPGKVYDIYIKYDTGPIGNGAYYMDDFDVDAGLTRYYWNVSADDGNVENSSDTYHFFSTGHESKIWNTGSTVIKGYLLVDVQYYDPVNFTFVCMGFGANESTPRTLDVGEQVGLDTIFNGLAYTSDIIEFMNDLPPWFGPPYRVYAAFRDPDGNVLKCDDETYLEAYWDFTVTSP